MFDLLQHILGGVLLSGLMLSLSFVMIFRERFSKKTQEKYLSYWKLKETFMAWIVFLPVGLLFLIYTLNLIVQFTKLLLGC